VTTDAIAFEEGFKPGFLGRMIQMQGEYYDIVWAVPDMNFEVMMARQMCDFHDEYMPGRDLLLTAHVDGILAGYIAVVGSEIERPGARLRWFLTDEKFRGWGIGRELLTRALDFCRHQGFKIVWLWTMEGLDRARRLYDHAGFQLVPDATVSMPEHGIILELPLG
jgi:GNAT superfamily N-acetyltransferase